VWVAAVLALACAAGQASAGEAPAVGHAAPALIARQFDGQPLDLAALRGQVVVLNFWASWCGPCREEMPQLEALARDFHDRGLVVIGLSADDRHDRADALKIARQFSYALGMLSEATRNDFGSPRSLPLTYLIDREGVIRTVLRANRGAVSAEALRAAAAALLP
jgi:peroxiredoxin